MAFRRSSESGHPCPPNKVLVWPPREFRLVANGRNARLRFVVNRWLFSMRPALEAWLSPMLATATFLASPTTGFQCMQAPPHHNPDPLNRGSHSRSTRVTAEGTFRTQVRP